VDAVDFVLLASGYRENGDFAEAAKLYEAALAKDPKTPRGAYLVGSAKKRMGDYAGAVEWLEKARAAEPTDPSAPYLLARILLGIDRKSAKKEETDPVKALALAQEASKLAGGESPQMLELLARCQAATGDAAAAEKTVKKILKLVEEEEKPYFEKLAAELKGK
jgi:tetratricopeptide (TPR) repeat protein